jgi:hypothetical protein
MKAVLLKKDYNGKLEGEVLMNVEDSWTHNILSNGTAELISIPDGLDNDHLKVTDVAEVVEVIEVIEVVEVQAVTEVLEVIEVVAADEYWSKEGEDDLLIDPVDVSWTHVPAVDAVAPVAYVAPVTYVAPVAAVAPVAGVPAHKIIEQDAAAVTAATAQASLATAKATMDTDIRAFVSSKTGSTGDVEMQAQVSSFSLRAANSTEYAAEGLTAHVASASFTLGEVLDTAQKVQDFYTEILVEMDKDRQAHIITYLTTKAGLGL